MQSKRDNILHEIRLQQEQRPCSSLFVWLEDVKMREYRTVPCMKWVKQLQAIAIKGFRGREPIWTYINNSTHHKYCFCMILLAASQQCGLSRERRWEPLPWDQFTRGLRALVICRAVMTCVWLPPVTALAPAVLFAASTLKVQLLTYQISGLGTSQPLKHSHAEGWIAAVDRGHFNSLAWVIAQFTHSVYHILISF